MLTVASYNIRKAIGTDRLRRPERICEVLAELDADIVTLQEADRRFGQRVSALPPGMIADCTDYMPVAFDMRPGSLGWHGNAILIRKAHMALDAEALIIPSLEPRGAVLADIAIKGVGITVVGMHLDLSGLWRRRQARAILARLAERGSLYPAVLMGDLNEWTRSGGCLHDFAHAHRIAHTGPSYHSQRPIGRLDRIIVGPGLHIEAAGVHHSVKARRASDHLPVWARLRFE